VKIQHHYIHGPQSHEVPARESGNVHVVVGSGRGTRLMLPLGWISVTLVMQGMLELGCGDMCWHLASRHFQVWLDGGLQHISRNPCWWLCVAAPAQLWRELPGKLAGDASLIPREAGYSPELGRPLVHLARTRWFADGNDTAAVTDSLTWLRDTLLSQQQAMHQQLHRCSGRTALRRHQTLLRLLRVQHLIRCNIDDRLDLTRLAAIANYSPTHLIRVYRDVFGETPSEYAARLRHQRAWELVCTTDLSVCEIAESLGFESESAFCRAFRHAFGCTTTEVRRQCPLLASPPPAPARAPAQLMESIS
jgi:AraC family transcriptional regulator